MANPGANEGDFRKYRAADPEEYDIVYSDDEEHYKKPDDGEDFADLLDQMQYLKEDQSDLDGPEKPPNLFSLAQLKHSFNNIGFLKAEADKTKSIKYLEEFEASTKDDILTVGKISLKEIQEEEKRLRDEHLAFEQQELERIRSLEQEVLTTEEIAKKRVAANLKEKRRQLARRVEIAKQRERLQLDALHKSFRRGENKLTTRLVRSGGVIKTMYGDLSLADGEYGGAKGRRWKLEWENTPIPVQIKVKSILGVKDKLPGGRYVIMASLYNRLGGSVLRWSKLKGQQWGGATLPVIHNGNFFNFEMPVNQSVFMVLPPPSDIKPSMTLVFEVFLLRGSVVQTDRVVAWGCFPICRNDISLIEGKFKTPLLRGTIDSRIDKFAKIEELMSSDLDHWLCNLYFDVTQLPRYMAGQREYEVELLFNTDLIQTTETLGKQFNKQEKTPAQYLSKSNTELQTDETDSKEKTTSQPVSASRLSVAAEPENPTRSETRGETRLEIRPDTAKSKVLFEEISSSENTGSLDNISVAEIKKSMSPEFRKRPMTTVGSRYAKRDHRVHLDDSSSSDDDFDDEDLVKFQTERSQDVRIVKGQPDLTYMRYLNEQTDIYDKKIYTMLPQTALLRHKHEHKHLTDREKLQLHTHSVRWSEARLKSGGSRRSFEYIRRQLRLELGLTSIFDREFWALLLIFVMTFFLRIYVHYIGQWLLLTAQFIPINNFALTPYTVKLIYQETLLHTVEVVFLVMLGPLAVFFIYIFGVILTAISLKLFQELPALVHKFVLCLGIQSIMDPIFVMIVDCALRSYDYARVSDSTTVLHLADFSKLYWHYMRIEGAGLGGILLTIFIYSFTIFISCSVFYMHFLRLYNNGRMLDIYWRLSSKESDIFFPIDLELSYPDFESIIKKAEQWRGEEGERRKITVYEYVWEEENLEKINAAGVGETKIEKTTHVSIHTVHLDGLRELFRHFLVLPDGAIVEVFGEKTSLDEFERNTKTARSRTRNQSQLSARKVRGRETVFTRAAFREDTINTDTESMSADRESSIDSTDKKNI